MPYGNRKPKKMGSSGGGPHMYEVGSKEKNSPMNFSDKAMMYMKKMPAMYGKPKMTNGEPIKGLPDSNKERVKLIKDFRRDVHKGTPKQGELASFYAKQKKEEQMVKERTKDVTNEVKMQQAFDELKTRGGATQKEIETIRNKYDPDRKITNKLREAKQRKSNEARQK